MRVLADIAVLRSGTTRRKIPRVRLARGRRNLREERADERIDAPAVLAFDGENQHRRTAAQLEFECSGHRRIAVANRIISDEWGNRPPIRIGNDPGRAMEWQPGQPATVRLRVELESFR